MCFRLNYIVVQETKEKNLLQEKKNYVKFCSIMSRGPCGDTIVPITTRHISKLCHLLYHFMWHKTYSFFLRLLSLPFHYLRKMNIFLFRVSSPDSVVYRFQGVISSLLTLVDVIRSLLVYPNWNFEEDKETIKGVSLFLNLIFFFLGFVLCT